MRRIYHLVFLIILLAACAPGSAAAPTPIVVPPAPVRIALLPVTDVIPIYVAQAEGYFVNAGLEVIAVPVSSAAERGTVVQTAGADCELTDLHGVILTNASPAMPMRVVATARQATADQPLFFLLGAPDGGISDAGELAGASIAISENTIIDYWNDRILAAAGVDATRITRTNVPQLPVRLELLMNSQVDAAVLPDPLASLAQLQGAPLLADDTLRPDVAVSVLACRSDFIEAKPNDVQRLIAGWDQAVAAMNADPDAFRNVLIEQTRVPEPLQDRYNLPRFPEEQIPSAEQVADVAAWLVERGLIEAAPAYDEVVDASFRP
jgi:NitT/TauT family transport system substrate-binding protein